MQFKFHMTYRYKTVFVTLILLAFIAFTGHAQENTDEYKKTIESADNYFSKGDYINAKASYQIAVRLAPNEQYPKDRLQQSLDMIKVQMNISSLYSQKIQLADDLFDKKDFEGALKVYQEALTIIPGDNYATGKIQEISKSLSDARILEENYQKNIINGDKLLKEGNLEKALAEYQSASKLKPAETYPKEKINQIEKQVAESKTISGAYETALQSADQAISHNKYDEAINYLDSAIKLKPDETLPRQKLAEAQNLKTSWDSYSSIISEADNFYIAKEFEKAKDKYLQAQSIKPSDEYPKRMLEKIDIALMDVSNANRSSYEVSIALADKLFNEQDYEEAMIEYKNALHFKPDEQYAKQRISDINKALSLRKTQDEAYAQSIAKADNLYKEERYSEARDEYTRASGIKSLEEYPKVKIDELNALLSKLASQREIYDNLIKGADRLFFSDKYVEAREQYRAAVDLFPKEKYPNDQIVMINEILGVRDKYTKSVTTADQLLYKKDYEGALLEYRNAAGINPKETYPLDKIKEIETIMSANEKAQKDLADKKREAVPPEEEEVTKEDKQQAADAYQKNKVFEIEADTAELAALQARDNQYQDAIIEADRAMVSKDYEKALSGYQAALGIKPNESYPQGKIDEINRIKAELAKEALENQYKDAISNADKALAAKDYQKALTGYRAALSLKPGESYPQGKVTEINSTLGEIAAKEAQDNQYRDAISNADKALAAKDYQKALTGYRAALSFKPGESYPQGKVTEINSTLGEIAAKEAQDNQYRDAISNADKALAAKDYQKALTGYQAALSLKPGESYPQGKVTEINSTLGEIAAKEAQENQYRDAISNADKALAAKDYQKALTGYQAALSLKPGESYPQGKVTEINSTLGEIAAKEAQENQYRDAISNADKALAAKDYQKALTGYQAALSIKPGESYPQGKVTEINSTLGEIAAKEAQENQYRDAISNADKALAAKDYQKALTGLPGCA